MKFLYDLKLPKLPLFISILSKVLLSSNLFSLFPPSTKNNHSSPPKKSYKNKFSKIQIENYVQKKKPKIIQICAFKEKEKEKEGGARRP
jgi:hypothetical protein